MKRLALVVGVLMMLTSASAGAASGSESGAESLDQRGRAIKVILDPNQRVHDINVAYSFTTTLWFPVNCLSVTVGDTETFAAIINPRFKNRVILTPLLEERGSTTNVTIDCEEGVRVVLQLRQTSPEKAVQGVEFEKSAEEEARIREIVETTEKRLGESCAKQTNAALERGRREAEKALLRGMFRRFKASEDIERARKDFVIVKVFRQVLVGERGIIAFQVQNRTDNDVVVRDVEVVDEETREPVDNPVLVLADKRVAPDSIAMGVIAFDTPEEANVFRLVVREDGARVIEVGDIDF